MMFYKTLKTLPMQWLKENTASDGIAPSSDYPHPTPPLPQRIKSQCLEFRNSFDLFPAPLPFIPIRPCKNLWDSPFLLGRS